MVLVNSTKKIDDTSEIELRVFESLNCNSFSFIQNKEYNSKFMSILLFSETWYNEWFKKA
jgi:hypothetical protein